MTLSSAVRDSVFSTGCPASGGEDWVKLLILAHDAHQQLQSDRVST